MKTCCLLGLLCLCFFRCHAGDPFNRIWAHVTVNGKPATLVFDTGADGVYLFRPAAQRLGLSFTNVSNEAKLAKWVGPSLGLTEQAQLSFQDRSLKVRFGVFNKSSGWGNEGDGLLGWPIIEKNIFEVHWGKTNGEVETLATLPKDIKTWSRFRIRGRSRQLTLEIPEKGYMLFTLLDTGNPAGVCLPPRAWQVWRRAHPQQPLTLTGITSFYVDPIAAEESFARQYSLGPLNLTDVPVMLDTFSPRDSTFDLVIGLAMLERTDTIIDGRHSCVYLRPKTTPPRRFIYNRAGVIFNPRDFDAVARVMPGSPADEAGVRDGDILIGFNGKWRIDWVESPNNILCTRPAGTRVELVLRREERTIHATITLRDILEPDSSNSITKPTETPVQK